MLRDDYDRKASFVACKQAYDYSRHVHPTHATCAYYAQIVMFYPCLPFFVYCMFFKCHGIGCDGFWVISDIADVPRRVKHAYKYTENWKNDMEV
jgi:hypothetical protein